MFETTNQYWDVSMIKATKLEGNWGLNSKVDPQSTWFTAGFMTNDCVGAASPCTSNQPRQRGYDGNVDVMRYIANNNMI